MKAIMVSSTLYSKLETLACERLQDVNVYASELLGNALSASGENTQSPPERRKMLRLPVDIPVILHLYVASDGYESYKAAKIKDIADGGVGIHLDAMLLDKKNFDAGTQFEVILQSPDEAAPLRIACQIRRLERMDDSTLIGAEFNMANQDSTEAIHNFLYEKLSTLLKETPCS